MRCYTKSKTDLFCNKCLACIKMCMAILFTAEIIGTLTKPPTLLTKYGSDIFFCCLATARQCGTKKCRIEIKS